VLYHAVKAAEQFLHALLGPQGARTQFGHRGGLTRNFFFQS
jgi:hypothetical protein